jgi:5-formyltetrahydrofolate cyclo-ligase
MISEQKAVARTEGFARRKAAHEVRGDCASRATDHLLSYLADMGEGLVISGYMPIRTEIDALPAMEALHGLGHRICVPVIVRPGLPLSFREWTPDCEMVNGPFGAKVPAGGDWLAPDVLIVPLVSFDMQGFRLGYGGGYYDRSLELLRNKKPTLAVGYAYSGQMGEVPVEITDQRLDAMVTEGGVNEFIV